MRRYVFCDCEWRRETVLLHRTVRCSLPDTFAQIYDDWATQPERLN
jgi:hypothetical protein